MLQHVASPPEETVLIFTPGHEWKGVTKTSNRQLELKTHKKFGAFRALKRFKLALETRQGSSREVPSRGLGGVAVLQE